jgi:broad specificity phosphatase PhoE
MKLLLVRHAETDINLQEITHKSNDKAQLTQNGRNQAEALIGIFRNYSIERIYSSPEARAIETAEIVASGINKPIEVIVGLAERNWGQWGGKNWEEIENNLKKMTIEERYNFIPPSGESWKEMDDRLKKVIDRLVNGPEENVAIITHEGTLRALITLLNKAPKASSLSLHFNNASITMFENTNSKFTQQTINDISHLGSLM